MEPHLSDLTWGRLEMLIDDLASGDVKDNWTRRVMRQSGVEEGATCADGDALRRVEAWMTDTRPEAYRAALSDLATDRRCDARLLELARDRGVNAAALAIIACATGGPACVDMGGDGMGDRQISVRRDGNMDEVMVPLDMDVHWTGRHLLIRRGTLPDTVLEAAAGRRAGDLVGHPAMAHAGEVVALEDDTGVGAFDILRLEESALPWREAIEGMLQLEAC